MPNYESYHDSVEKLQKLIVDGVLKPVAFEQFKIDRGMAVKKVLPDKSSNYDFSSHGFSGIINPDNRDFYNVTYNGYGIETNNLPANPSDYDGICRDINELWYDTFGEVKHMSNQPGHPGEIPISKDNLRESLNQLIENRELICADPSVDDLVHAIQNKNYKLAAHFLGVEEPQQVFTPGGGHELAELFTNGEIHIIYNDRDVALLKPEYNHEIREDVMNHRRRTRRVSLRGEPPEEAFVVGRDDTPVGLFAHVVDGTQLDIDQNVTREYIHNVMGFDRNYDHDMEILRLDVSERLRLQGDFAVQYLGDTSIDDASVCYLPIDNHFASIKQASLAEGESLEREPVRIHVPERTVLNIAHDEHENIVVEMQKGEYKLFLLKRGLKIPSERPDWPDETKSVA